ncbi:hypothetical protein Clacol_010299 [Clathrus columnatus]|uniref:Uncharacterized protein n=1 Tax=Clathrus columnatus TaxID=1419009 RepID=A0AAV5ANH2_9AGAM|nr:hypothetical protein Clacol_010299 [Clathrus columnatus]
MSHDYKYVFRVPIASSISPRPTSDETMHILHHLNKSQPADKRLPAEILILIHNEVHANPLYEKIHSTWTSVTEEIQHGSFLGIGLKFNKATRSYYKCRLPVNITPEEREQGHVELSDTVSSADLLYRLRLRCFFPDIYVQSGKLDGYESVWGVCIESKEHDAFLVFSEHKTMLTPSVFHKRDVGEVNLTAFVLDVLELSYMLFEVVDGTRCFGYFHPAAKANSPAINEHFLAVPDESLRDHVDGEDFKPYSIWDPVKITSEDFSFKSVLSYIRYNINSRKIDTINGTEDLTTIISSSLLFYRLQCHFVCDPSNAINTLTSMTSIWQVKLHNRTHDVPVLFMDNRGLFDIRNTI